MVLKQCFPRLKPEAVNCRKYRNFCYDKLKTELEKEILKHNINKMEYQHFLNVFIEILNKYVFMKQKYLKAIKGSLMTKYLQKLDNYEKLYTQKYVFML